MSSHVLPADALAPGGAAASHPNALAPLAGRLDRWLGGTVESLAAAAPSRAAALP
jgi:hypothetical protein